jgi:hypothetical protein
MRNAINYNPDRIVFGLRVFQNTYNFHGAMKDLESIVLRHDSSGEYPFSEPDFVEEVPIQNKARQAADRLYKTLFKGIPEPDLTASPDTMLSNKPSESSLRGTPTIAESVSDDRESKSIGKKRKTQADSNPIGRVRGKLDKRRKR